MSIFMEQTVASSNKSTPRVVIRKDAKFKSACNKMRWLNKASEADATAGNSKGSTAGSEKATDENGSQFYSFYEKADPSLDESVNPPVKLPSALLVSVHMAVVVLCAYMCTYVHTQLYGVWIILYKDVYMSGYYRLWEYFAGINFSAQRIMQYL